MSQHPNVILLAVLKPDGLSRKTMRDIIDNNELAYRGSDWSKGPPDIKVAGHIYHAEIMESNFDNNWQISGDSGDLMFFDLVTYGYGEAITWTELSQRQMELEKWAQETCNKHQCTHEIRVSANYW